MSDHIDTIDLGELARVAVDVEIPLSLDGWMTAAQQACRYYVSKANEVLGSVYGMQLLTPIIQVGDFDQPVSTWISDNAPGFIRISDLARNTFPASCAYYAVAHSTAHLTVCLVDPNESAIEHGDRWQKVMAVFEQPILEHSVQSAHHTTETTEIDEKTDDFYVIYQCKCRRHKMGAEQHNEIATGIDYRCRRCHQPINMRVRAGG